MSIVRFPPKESSQLDEEDQEKSTAASPRPSQAQLRYLRLGLKQPGGKLPLFDEKGQEIKAATIRSCIEKGWAEPWFANPLKPGWLVCKITDKGKQIAAQKKKV